MKNLNERIIKTAKIWKPASRIAAELGRNYYTIIHRLPHLVASGQLEEMDFRGTKYYRARSRLHFGENGKGIKGTTRQAGGQNEHI